MILLTVGTQLPFDRLVAITDEIAPTLDLPVFGQTGPTPYVPKNFEAVERIEAVDFDRKFREANLIVSHAGIGTVLTAQKYKKPIILFPRVAALGEHRNDHQAATCKQLRGRPGIYIAEDANQLREFLNNWKLLKAADDSDLHSTRSNFWENLRSHLNSV